MSRTRITVQTLLGDNAVAALGALVPHLRDRSGLDVRFAHGDGARPSDDRSVWDHDLVWACGLVTARTLGSGGFDGDVVAAPVFAGESSAVYRSAIVARPGGPVRALADLARCRVAVNETASWSGCRGPLSQLAAEGHGRAFGATVITGTHRRSVEAVADGRADAAAIDCTVWRHLGVGDPTLAERAVAVDVTRDWPAPPFTLHRRLDAATRARLLDALTAPTPGDVPAIDRIVACDAHPYRAMLASVTAC